MLSKIKHLIKNTPILYKILYFIKYKVVNPIKSGRYAYFIKYLFTMKRKECKKLISLGLLNPKPISFFDWRIGKGKDRAFRRYYLAEFNGKKCFIKIGKNDATVHNEFVTLSKLPVEVCDFSPNLMIGQENFDENTTMLAVEFIEGLQKFTCPTDIEKFNDLCEQFIHILDVLEAQNLVHADIHKGNLMLCEDKLYLLDYGISMFKEQGNNINYVARPGTFYRTVEDSRIYDDAYSFTKLIEALNTEYTCENVKALQNIYNRIDQNSFKVKI